MEDVRLGPYQLLAELGSGGMGKVYRAEVQGPVPGLEAGRSVALKVIHAHLLETPGFFKRFLREADIGRTIEHENVVRTYDCDALLHAGVQQNFLVMEYVEGQTLRDLLDELERVPEELCRHVGREIAKGLAAIHEAGVVHRDLKPENVLITRDHVVKVMDLGVARLQDEAIRLSQTGAFLGSIEYAAPEQFRSADGEPDGRADLHALGVLLYELSTGQHPYRDEDVSKVLRNILDETPRKAGEVNPQLSPFFEEVVHALIEKDRDERFGAAADLVVVLEEGERSEWWKKRAKALRVETKRPLRRIRIPRETALYGRDDELAKIHALYDRAKAGDGQVLLIEGEAGIGKTRLVDELVGRLRQEGEDLNFLFGSYPPGGAATAAGAFSTAYREHFGEEGLEEALREHLAVTPLLVPAFAALLRGDAAPAEAEPLTKESLQAVFLHATRGLAAERPTIVLIDDLHFAPEEGRSLFSSLAMAVAGHPVLLIGTTRPGIEDSWKANFSRLDHAEPIALTRLGPKDLARLLEDAFHSERLARELGHQIAVKSDGNPFFAFEIIRGLREGQFITQKPDGTWVTTQVIQDIQVPSSVVDMVRARLRDLGEEERELLDVASCCGYEFAPRLVGDVVGLGRVPVLRALGRIEREHRLVRSSGRRFVFDHHQVQEALVGELHDELGEAYHAAIADTMEAHAGAADQEPGSLDGSLCVDLCEHFLEGALGERALRYLEPALKHLSAGYLSDRVVALSDRALEAHGLLTGTARIDILLRKISGLELLGRGPEQEILLDEARVLAEASEDRAWMGRVERSWGVLLDSRGRLEEARAHFEQSLAIARQIGELGDEAAATINIGTVLLRLGRVAEAQEHSERGLDLAWASGNRHWETAATVNIGNVLQSLARYPEALEYYERGLALAKACGNRQFEINAMGNLGIVLQRLDRHDEARQSQERTLDLARAGGFRRSEINARANLGSLLERRGRYAEAMAQFDQYLALSEETGDRDGAAGATCCTGVVWLRLGQFRRAGAALESCLASTRDRGHPRLEAYALLNLSFVADEEGDVARALDLAASSLALCREIRARDYVPTTLFQIGSLRAQAGDLDAARAALDEAVSLWRERQETPSVAGALALIARLFGGDARVAETALADAGASGNTARTRHDLWLATRDTGHLAEAKRLLDDLVEHAPEAYRASMVENVRLYREITEAWAEHARLPNDTKNGG